MRQLLEHVFLDLCPLINLKSGPGLCPLISLSGSCEAFCQVWCHSLAVMGWVLQPSANLPPPEPMIWLFIWSAELPAVAPGWEQMLGREPAALGLEPHAAWSGGVLSRIILMYGNGHWVSPVPFRPEETRRQHKPRRRTQHDTSGQSVGCFYTLCQMCICMSVWSASPH